MKTRKTCSRCEAEKDITEFGRNAAKEDGLQNYCLPCMREYSRSHGRRKPEGWARKTADMKAYQAIYRQKNKDRLRKQISEWKNKNRNIERERIKSKVRYAIKIGKLIRLPCITCGDMKVDAHHPDYSNPLDVVWLCKTHHQQLHAEQRSKTK
jgi:hypothetical protein